MILYHFCAAHMLPAIMKEGLTLGRWPIIGAGYQTWPKSQWLTKNPDPKKQSWATHNLVSYSRTAYRLTVRIPDNYRKKLVQARKQMMHVPPKDREIITELRFVRVAFDFFGKVLYECFDPTEVKLIGH